MIAYFLKLQLCLLLGMGAYELWWKNQPFFRRNRAYLLGLMLVACVFPLLPIPSWQGAGVEFAETVSHYWVITDGGGEEQIVQEETRTAALAAPLATQQVAINWGTLLLAVYLGIASMLMGRILWHIWQIRALWRKGKRQDWESFTLVQHAHIHQPFSFFSWFFFPEDFSPEEDQQVIIQHEKAHMDGWHSLDNLLAECFLAINWINPMAHLLKHRLREQHEFLADRAACDTGIRPSEYGQVMLRFLGARSPHIAMAPHFGKGQLFRRLQMLNQPSTMKPMQRFKWFMTLPLLALGLALGYSFFPSATSSTPIHIIFRTEKPTLYMVLDEWECQINEQGGIDSAVLYQDLFLRPDGSKHPLLDHYQIKWIQPENKAAFLQAYVTLSPIVNQTSYEMGEPTVKETQWLSGAHDVETVSEKVANRAYLVQITNEQGEQAEIPIRYRFSYTYKPGGQMKHLITEGYARNPEQAYNLLGIDWLDWRDALAAYPAQDIWLETGPTFEGMMLTICENQEGMRDPFAPLTVH